MITHHHARAQESEIAQHIPSPQVVGQAMFSYLFWDIYEATLFSADGNWPHTENYALKLTYQRDFEGEKIAEKSIEEMRKQGLKDPSKIDSWLEQMRMIFPDVKENESITGVVTSEQASVFYHQGTKVGEVTDPEFSQRFFAIWLSEDTSEPRFRAKLLNLQK